MIPLYREKGLDNDFVEDCGSFMHDVHAFWLHAS